VTPERQPVAGQRYVFPSGRFLVSPDGRTISSFETNIACAPAELPPLAVSAEGVFRLERTIAGVRVEIIGGFADPRGASLTLRFRSGRCDSGIVRLDAHLA
jgi:hypothetical protein